MTSTPITYLEEIKRKLIHLSSLWMPLLILATAEKRWIAAAVFAAGLLLTLISEHAYACRRPGIGRLYGALFGKMLRQEPEYGAWVVSGGAPVLAAALLVSVIFKPVPAAGALIVMLTGDAAAALVGRRWGRHKLVNGKSLEGTLAFVAAGYIMLALMLAFCRMPLNWFCFAVPAVAAGAAVELFQKQLRIDDNFTIPLTVGIILQFLPLV